MENQEVEQKQESEFARRYHEEKLLKRAQKKARKQLKAQGYSHKESQNLIKHALNRITSNKPERKAAGRGG
jgi:hypothetical protein